MKQALQICFSTVAMFAIADIAAAADTPPASTSPSTVSSTTAVTLDTPAQTYYRQSKPVSQPAAPSWQQKLDLLPREGVTKPKNLGVRKIDGVQRLDEIRIYSYTNPEDYITPEKSPLLQMRDRLDRVRRPTPAEQVHNVLCMAGFCGGIPEEISTEARRDMHMHQNALDTLVNQRGPLQ